MPSTQPDSSNEESLKARIRDLEAVLGQNNLTLAVTFKLPPSLSNLLGLLLALPLVTPEAIQHRLEIATDAKVAMHRLRQSMKPWKRFLEIEDRVEIIEGRRHLGYWIEADVKEKIRAASEKAAEQMAVAGGAPPLKNATEAEPTQAAA